MIDVKSDENRSILEWNERVGVGSKSSESEDINSSVIDVKSDENRSILEWNERVGIGSKSSESEDINSSVIDDVQGNSEDKSLLVEINSSPNSSDEENMNEGDKNSISRV